MSYFRRRPGMGDDFNLPDIAPGDEQGSTSTSSTTQDTTVTPSGATVGGQDTGVPTATYGAWKNVGGVCYATNATFLAQLKELQRQLNRIADAYQPTKSPFGTTPAGLAKIGVDGSVGPATISLMGQIAKLGAFKQMGNASLTCDNVCANVLSFTGAAQVYANSLGASSSVASPAPATTPSYFDPGTQQIVPQNQLATAADIWGNLSSTTQMMVIGSSAALAYWAYSNSKKSGRKSGRTRRY